MDIQPTHQNPVTDDQELAKVLAGVDKEVGQLPEKPADDQAAAAPAGLQFEETPMQGAPADPAAPAAEPAATLPAPDPAATPEPEAAQTAVAEPAAVPTPAVPTTTPAASGDLEDLKKDALEELRPLVSKLDLPADEKFDTMLLIIRSTDDKSLLQPAHDAAKEIQDDTKRAQALLDIIKEIDYFSGQGQQPAA